jgi:phosphate ABC transporter permease protein PstC/phosphate ABC transporter permease subunit PstA
MGRPSQRVAKGEPEISATSRKPLPRGKALDRRIALLRGIGTAFHVTSAAAAAAVIGFLLGLVAVLYYASGSSIAANHGLAFLTGSVWDPAHNIYGAGPALFDTLLTSAFALLLAVPIALGVAIFLSEIAPRWLAEPLTYVIDLSAAIPSVVYGLWAFLVIVPLMKNEVEPSLASTTHGGWPFSGYPLGFGIMTASLILAVMILPTIAALSREALRSVPRVQREAALSLGATRWESTRMTVLGSARPGIEAAILIGLGRALGETIAVAMVINNFYAYPTSLFSGGQTLTSQIANEFGSAEPVEFASLIELGLVLLAITILVNIVARLILRRRTTAPTATGAVRRSWWRRPHAHDPYYQALVARQAGHLAAEPTATRAPRAWRGRIAQQGAQRRGRRKAVHAAFVVLTFGCILLSVAPIASVLLTSWEHGGAAVVRPSFYVSEFPLIPCTARPGNATVPATTCDLGGIGPAIQGTLILLGVASLIAVPIGLMAGIYLAEYGKGRVSRAVSFFADVMLGVPTILLGLFALVVFLTYDHNFAVSALTGGFALGIVMLPIVTRATEEALRSVPLSVREAALALGFPPHRVTVRVVLGSARNALITGMLLALSRAAGDTAALFVTIGYSNTWFQGLNQPTSALAVVIFNNFSQVYGNWHEDAWGATLVLLVIILVLNLIARVGFGRRAGLGPAETG